MIRRAIKYLINYRKLTVVALAAFLFSCSPVKFVPEDRYLLNKVEVEVDNSTINKEEAKLQIRQKENYKILGFAKFYLWMYNLSSKKKANSWLKKIGEPPEVFDESLVGASEARLKQYLGNKGFFRANVNTDVMVNENRRKANVRYKVETGEQYKIRKVNYHISDSTLKVLFFNDSAKAFIRPGTPFDFSLLEQQRSKIVNLFKNEGYYYFSKDEVSYLADSSLYEKEVVLDLYIGSSPEQSSEKKFEPYSLNHFYISVLPGSVPVSAESSRFWQFSDTIRWENHTLFSNPEIRYRPRLFDSMLQMKNGSLYRLDDARHTFDAFNRLRQFRFIDIQFSEPEMPVDTNLLDCHIRLAPLSKQAVSFDVEGTNTSGNLGMAGNVNFQHRNMFRGAEVLQLNLKGAIERQQRTNKNVTEYFNTRELGSEMSLTIPKILGTRKLVDAFWNLLPKTIFTVGYNYQRRPEYTRTISSLKFGYDWMTSEYRKHTWNLLDFNMVTLYQFDPSFIEMIKDLYIKSSFTDHLIFAMNYSFVHNTHKLGTFQNYFYLRFNVESAGNLLYLLSETLDRKQTQVVDSSGPGTSEFYTLFKTRFAQYIKSDLEFRYGYIIDKYNAIVGRAFFGAGLPYGNFDVLPFEKKYFTGGANGIRAWQVRALGPGTYKAPENEYPNQSSDIKLEANLEYRFKLMSFLEGALFFDAGNIWAINEKDNRPGAQFKLNEFYKQLALGTGTGFRFDFNYFIFRLDLGMKLRDPSQEADNGWIIGHRKYTGDDFNISFAIGYPF
ncbi:translocation and assembly module lipoprotein TamL [Mariniphaga anaerophila]|uniref:translocation and assembly module lipoprotein TamL n=1 Tax=Mariniphaga anaerophila TaxID=1484053 RepID=UPI001587C51B|nr:BamA/TamA family outer membrane protein [Mariniphaga anaerophila]